MTAQPQKSLDPATTVATPPEETPNRYDPALAGPLADRLLHRDISPGDLAGLRRMDPQRPTSQLF